jgi:hypothetical protein
MRVRLAAVLICLLLALSLAGCVHADRAIALNSDGSGTYTYTIGLSSQLMDLGGGSLTDSMNQYGDQVKQDGGSYSRYEDGGYSYWKYVRPFTSVNQLDDFLGESPQSQASGSLDNADEAHVSAQAGFFSTTYHATGHMSLQVPNADQATRDILKDARESFAITMPNWVSERHGGQQNGNTVTYTVHFDEAATIDVTGVGLNVPHIALVAGGVLLAIILIIVGVLLLLRRSRRTPPQDTGAVYAAPTSASFPASYARMPQGSDAPTLPATPSFPPEEPPMLTPTPE